MKNLRKICGHLDAQELLAQLAEEAGELTQAALKLRRAITGKNPTPVSKSDATYRLISEIADVQNCIDAVMYSMEMSVGTTIEIARLKRERWVKRLEVESDE